MMLGALTEAALRTLLLAAAVQLSLWVFRVDRVQLLLATWTVVLAASLAMPALQWATPLRLPVVPDHAAAWLIGVADHEQQAVPVVSGPVSAAHVQTLPAMAAWLVAAYLLVSSIMLLRLIVGVALSLRLLSRAEPIPLKSAPEARIRISREVAAPVTVGSVILLPPDVVEWPPAMRQAAIAHECAHVAREDFALLVLSQINRALFWFSPVSWLLHRRLAELAELASDDYAMTVTRDPNGYAEVLLEMGRRSGPLLRGLAMARASTLPYRIERVLSGRVTTAPVSRLQRSMVVASAAIVSLAAASPDFNPGASSPPALAISGDFAFLPEQTGLPLSRPSPTPPQIEEASPSPRSAAPIGREIRAAPQQPSSEQMAARPVTRPMAGNAHTSPPARSAQVRNRAGDTQGDVVARPTREALSLPRSSPGIGHVDPSNIISGAGEASYSLTSQREGHPPPRALKPGKTTAILVPAGYDAGSGKVEPSLLGAIDQQTCNGVYFPGSNGGTQSGAGWGYLNFIRTKFFRAADGKPWLKFYLGVRDPVNLPVTMTGREVEFTAGYNTSFKMLLQGTKHLTGTTERPSGTIDFACDEAGAHTLD